MSLDPLADYLKPKFGDIYSYNLHDHDGPGIEVQERTDELREAVNHYLLTEVDDGLFASLLDWLVHDAPPADRGKQIDVLIAQVEPWQIAHTLHLIAVVAVPTLDDLIGSRSSWSHDGLQDDVAEWLDANASSAQVRELTEIVGRPKLDAAVPWYTSEPTGEHFTRALEPPELLAAWYRVVPVDLTEGEWELLAPLVQRMISRYRSLPSSDARFLALRRAFDGIRYKHEHRVPWSQVPRRYGSAQNIYHRYLNYRERGDFARLLGALRGQPGAERVVTWLETIATMPPREA